MVFGDVGELLEMFKSCFPLSFLFFVPIFIILSPVSPVSAAHEFAAYRMQQYDLHGISYGKITGDIMYLHSFITFLCPCLFENLF